MIRVKSILGTDSIEINQNHFPDNSLFIKIDKNYFGGFKKAIVYEWHYESDAELFTLICLRKHFNASLHILEMPYCPHARMDRVKSDNDVFTLKYFCEIINSLNFDEVKVLDAHSNVAPALLHHCVNNAPTANIIAAINQSQADILFYPDEGAMKRYSENVPGPYAFGIKKRNWDDGKILGLEIINKDLVKDKKVLIIDDICSRGGTFYHSAKALKEAGASEVFLYVTHLEKTIFEGELWKESDTSKDSLVRQIYTANPLFEVDNNNLKITVV